MTPGFPANSFNYPSLSPTAIKSNVKALKSAVFSKHSLIKPNLQILKLDLLMISFYIGFMFGDYVGYLKSCVQVIDNAGSNMSSESESRPVVIWSASCFGSVDRGCSVQV